MRTLALLLPVAAVACADTDPAVFVDAKLESPSVAVKQLTLGASLSGHADLALHLGARASGPSSVSLGAFSIDSADELQTLVSPLPVVAEMATPVAVAAGSDAVVGLSFDSGTSLVDKAKASALCAGPIRISGVIQDSLEPQATPVVSEAFSASCAP